MSAPGPKLKNKTFKAPLEKLRNNLNWVIARVPFSVEKTWGTRGMLRVDVEVNGFDYRTSLFPTRSGQHFILVNKKVQRGAGIGVGNVVQFTVTPDFGPRQVVLPKELECALNEDRAVRKWFDRLSPWVRKFLTDPVVNAKSAETRKTRADRVAEQIMQVMEAEIELPPIMRQVFNRIPGAGAAWRKMTDTQRRGNLLAIFNQSTPQSQIRRIERMIEAAISKHGV
jgi:uncharacterized protein DUF1905/bacteriocin resistance YdeI/OmpD-like protein